uniref:Uncharacterized protein n=1 Tax=Parascaris univalens TaxID=6257 RepID=A0A915B3H5_PARUN
VPSSRCCGKKRFRPHIGVHLCSRCVQATINRSSVVARSRSLRVHLGDVIEETACVHRGSFVPFACPILFTSLLDAFCHHTYSAHLIIASSTPSYCFRSLS